MDVTLSLVKHFVASEDGPTAVEYAVVVAMIVISAITAISGLGTSLSTWFSNTNETFDSLADPNIFNN